MIGIIKSATKLKQKIHRLQWILVPRRGFEPPTREGHTPQACAYASSATGAKLQSTPSLY